MTSASSTYSSHVLRTAVALALSAAAFAPTALSAASPRHHVATHERSAAATDRQSAESCWKMTDSDHNYGYNVPCSVHGALQHH